MRKEEARGDGCGEEQVVCNSLTQEIGERLDIGCDFGGRRKDDGMRWSKIRICGISCTLDCQSAVSLQTRTR